MKQSFLKFQLCYIKGGHSRGGEGALSAVEMVEGTIDPLTYGWRIINDPVRDGWRDQWSSQRWLKGPMILRDGWRDQWSFPRWLKGPMILSEMVEGTNDPLWDGWRDQRLAQRWLKGPTITLEMDNQMVEETELRSGVRVSAFNKRLGYVYSNPTSWWMICVNLA